MASVFALDEDGDLDLTSGNLVVESDPATVGVIYLRKKFSMWLGAWFIDLSLGFPWLQNILGQKPGDLSGVGGLFRETCMTAPGAVSAAVDVTFDGTTRGTTVAFDVRLSDGSNAEGEVTQ